jgi:Putative prokaryotic signal transducing protein
MADKDFAPDELAEVLASIDPLEVQMARDFLTEAGIEAFVFDDESSRMLGTTAAIPARLMVHADRAVEARERLKELGFED